MKNISNRKPTRHSVYDYTMDGCYFVTTCTQNKQNIFGYIKNGDIILNHYGKIVKQQWLWLEKQYPYVLLDEFAVMPNHFHGLLEINTYDNNVGTGRDLSLPSNIKIKSLSELIGAFKTTSSKLIHQAGLSDFTWQRSFYDHIIRNEKSLDQIRNYVTYNAFNWNSDRNNIENI